MRIEEALEQFVKDKDIVRKGIELYNNGSINLDQITNLRVQNKITDLEMNAIIYGSCCYSENL